MIYPDDAAYYQSRAQAERRQADRASDPAVIRIHRALAEAYTQRAGAPGDLRHPHRPPD